MKPSEHFAGNADGRYDFNSIDDFLAGRARLARIFFGDVSNPNVDVNQQILGVYAQDTWTPGPQPVSSRATGTRSSVRATSATRRWAIRSTTRTRPPV